MIRQKMTIQLAILFLLLGTTMAWSKRMRNPRTTELTPGSQVVAAESKVNTRYSEDPKASESGYHLDEVYHPKGHGHSEEYVDSEDHKSHKEEDEAQGNEESDDTIKDDEYNEHSEKGGHKDFKTGGTSFDKHLKDHKANNRELENVKQHDIGEKFGGELTKEHKLGKHKDKSKGHKLHGFKNVYHKEEYGDHKTFHDEFLDSDHQHNYDDHHEHQEIDGGKFSKGFKHEGKNDKHDKGDEKHEWGKEEFDVHSEGKHDKGGNKSKHRHATKKHQGHYDANSHRQKNAVHKIKKGNPPIHVPHGGHHGPHQAQIEPYVSHYNSHQEPVNIPLPHNQPQSHQVNYEDNSHNSNEGHESHFHNHHGHGHNHDGHHSHGHNHHSHGGHHDNDDNDDYSKNSDHDTDYHERTSQNPQHRSSEKEQLEDKSDDKLVSNIKHETSTRTHIPILYKNQQRVNVHNPILQKQEQHSHKHQPHVHNHHSHTHKQSFTPNYRVQQYRKPVYQDNSHLRPSQPIRQEKYSEPFDGRLHHNHRIRYGFQPRNQHHNHNHNHRFNHDSHNHHHHQPFPRFPGFHNHHQGHGYDHSSHKNHSYSRHVPSNIQKASRLDIHAPKHDDSHNANRNEHRHSVSQRHYE